MKQLKFTDQAIEELDDILYWTITQFGARQAEAYKDLLLDRCRAIAEEKVVGRNCSLLLGAAPRSVLQYISSGEHFIVYLEGDQTIIVIGFLHQSSDLPRHVASLSKRLE